ncbi:hypothetical protein [Streptomyces sp. NPDC049040]|uniref:hypothetical protein n=1 Tax=Streptomyces sp. NPDC049040 TaxID=3365593 RepID=UPI00371163B4
MKLRTLLFAMAVPAVFLAGACSGSTQASSKPATHTTPDTTPAAPLAASTPPAPPGATHRDEVLALLQKTLTATHLDPTISSTDRIQPCGIDLGRIYPLAGAHPHTRETITAMLHAAGWKTATTGGSDESHLTTDTWDVFVTRETDITDDQGKKYETLRISAGCITPPSTPF